MADACPPCQVLEKQLQRACPPSFLTQRLLLKVDSHSACESVSYHQRRGGQVVGTHAVAQAAFKVPVAR